MTDSLNLLQELLKIDSFRVLFWEKIALDHPLQAPILRASDALPEHRQVQVVVSAARNEEAIRKLAPQLLPPLLDGLTIRDLRTGQVLFPVGDTDNLAEKLSDLLLPDIVVHIFGGERGTKNDRHYLQAELLYRLEDERVRSDAAHFSGDPNILFEREFWKDISEQGRPPEETAEEILDRMCLILEHQAAGERLSERMKEKRH